MTIQRNESFETRHGYLDKRSRYAPFLLLCAAGVLVAGAGLVATTFGEVWHPRASPYQADADAGPLGMRHSDLP